MKKLKLKKLECKRCGHVWIPRIPEVTICPKCKTALFDKEKNHDADTK